MAKRKFYQGKSLKINICPVCKKYAFTEPKYEICPICGWEDDPIQRKEPNYEGGANQMSLNEAIEVYRNGGQVK